MLKNNFKVTEPNKLTHCSDSTDNVQMTFAEDVSVRQTAQFSVNSLIHISIKQLADCTPQDKQTRKCGN